jgi:hypothetical protein
MGVARCTSVVKLLKGKKNRRVSGTSGFGMAAQPLCWWIFINFPQLSHLSSTFQLSSSFINFPTLLIFHQLSNSPHLSSTQQIPHPLTILCSICRPKDKDKVLRSRLPALEPPSSMQSSSSATYESRLRMNQFNPSASERTSSSSYITTRMAENFLLQDKLCGFSMGKSLTRGRRKSPKVQYCGLKKFVSL